MMCIRCTPSQDLKPSTAVSNPLKYISQTRQVSCCSPPKTQKVLILSKAGRWLGSSLTISICHPGDWTMDNNCILPLSYSLGSCIIQPPPMHWFYPVPIICKLEEREKEQRRWHSVIWWRSLWRVGRWLKNRLTCWDKKRRRTKKLQKMPSCS